MNIYIYDIVQKKKSLLSNTSDFRTLCTLRYGVVSVSRLLKIAGLFCKRALQKKVIALEYIRLSDTLHTPLCAKIVWYQNIACFVRLYGFLCRRGIHSRIHQTFWHPAHSCEDFLAPYTLSCTCRCVGCENIYMTPCKKVVALE